MKYSMPEIFHSCTQLIGWYILIDYLAQFKLEKKFSVKVNDL